MAVQNVSCTESHVAILTCWLRHAWYKTKASHAPGPGHSDNEAAHVTQVPNSACADQAEQHNIRLLALETVDSLNSAWHAKF